MAGWFGKDGPKPVVACRRWACRRSRRREWRPNRPPPRRIRRTRRLRRRRGAARRRSAGSGRASSARARTSRRRPATTLRAEVARVSRATIRAIPRPCHFDRCSAIARRWRCCSRAVGAGTLPPSLIFAGPDGVGKRAAALALAQALNCPTPVPATDRLALDACGECPVCRRIGRGLHPDVTVVEPGETGSIKIDVVREEIRKTTFKPFEARRRVDHLQRRRRPRRRRAERAAEDAGGAAAGIGADPGDRASASAAADGPLAMPGRALCAARASRRRPVADARARGARGRGARGGGGGARQPGRGARDGRDRRGGSAGGGRTRAGHRSPTPATRGQRLEATSDIVGKGKGSGASERDSLATHLHALASLLRDLGALGTGVDGRRRQRRSGAVAGAAAAVVWRRADASRRLPPSTARSTRSTATRARRSWQTGWC